MRYRKLDAGGDYTFGRGQGSLLTDSPEAVAQAVMTRLRLLLGEWFADTSEGTPWATEILGKHTQGTRDAALQQRILDTQGVLQIDSYDSAFDAESRTFSLNCTITTDYGQTTISETL